jgi:hypothetical protein
LRAQAHSAADWKGRVIYQLVCRPVGVNKRARLTPSAGAKLTDRFATDSSAAVGDAPCGNLKDYCGGTFKGIQNRLDYIADLGFNAIWSGVLRTGAGGGRAYIAAAQDLPRPGQHARRLPRVLGAGPVDHQPGLWQPGGPRAGQAWPPGPRTPAPGA